MENFNDRNYDAWRARHWLDEPEPDLPEINDPRVIDVWEEPEDEGDECPLPRYARVHVKLKPWEDDGYTEEMRYDDYLDEVEKKKGNKRTYTCPELEEAGKVANELFSLCEEFLKKHKASNEI